MLSMNKRNIVKRRIILIVLFSLFIIILILGCDKGPKSGAGFRLPEGNIAEGEKVFTNMLCLNCHYLANSDTKGQDTSKLVRLGGGVSLIKTHGELVSSVINPSHKIAKGYHKSITSENGKSKMKNYNDVMTVTELVDLVTFLQDKYHKLDTSDYQYRVYHMY